MRAVKRAPREERKGKEREVRGEGREKAKKEKEC